jgi:hypothetical protein
MNCFDTSKLFSKWVPRIALNGCIGLELRKQYDILGLHWSENKDVSWWTFHSNPDDYMFKIKWDIKFEN